MMIDQQKENEDIAFVPETNEDAGVPVFDSVKEETKDDLNQEFLSELEESEALSAESVVDLNETLEGAAEEQESEESDGALPISEELTLQGKIEAVIFASPKPLRSVEIHELLSEQGYNLKEVQDALDELTEYYKDRAGGFHLKYIKRMGYQFQTTTAAKNLMEKQFASRPRPLSRASLETLAVIAYRQKTNKSGVTRAEVEFIRGVDAGSIFKTLIERNLLTCVGRKEIPGRPMIFGVTDEFLKIFQLGSLSDLPPLESFQTPGDVIQAANEKISKFEAEQEGVNPEEFVGDEEYTENLGHGDLDVLGTEVAPFALTAEQAPVSESDAINAIPADILAEMAADTLEDQSEEDKLLAADEESKIAVPKAVIEELAEDLLNRLDEGQVGFIVPQELSEEREIIGASASIEETDETFAETIIVESIEASIVEDAETNVTEEDANTLPIEEITAKEDKPLDQ